MDQIKETAEAIDGFERGPASDGEVSCTGCWDDSGHDTSVDTRVPHGWPVMSSKQEPDASGYVMRPLCPFCSAPWTDDMIDVEASASEGCDTCGWGGGAYGEVRIVCASCDRLIYVKEFDKRH